MPVNLFVVRYAFHVLLMRKIRVLPIIIITVYYRHYYPISIIITVFAVIFIVIKGG